MAHKVCPYWVGYLLLNPLRKLLESPQKILAPFVRAGMTVLEPGCGMGYFSLPLARMVGPAGRVVVLDVQERMLAAVERRATKAGLRERIDSRLVRGKGLGAEDLDGAIDLIVAIHVLHEMPDQDLFFVDSQKALKPGAKLLCLEPKGHVSEAAFADSLSAAARAGLICEPPPQPGKRRAVLVKR